MGDRFYQQQKAYKPKRKLKADYVKELQELLDSEIPGLDKLTVSSLQKLIEVIERVLK